MLLSIFFSSFFPSFAVYSSFPFFIFLRLVLYSRRKGNWVTNEWWKVPGTRPRFWIYSHAPPLYTKTPRGLFETSPPRLLFKCRLQSKRKKTNQRGTKSTSMENEKEGKQPEKFTKDGAKPKQKQKKRKEKPPANLRMCTHVNRLHHACSDCPRAMAELGQDSLPGQGLHSTLLKLSPFDSLNMQCRLPSELTIAFLSLLSSTAQCMHRYASWQVDRGCTPRRKCVWSNFLSSILRLCFSRVFI